MTFERWYVQQVVSSEGSKSPTQFVSYCNQWILPSDSQITELLISGRTGFAVVLVL
ncbi:hypothetical protein DPMN_083928 [Dreissena polymorpha]|uniref:Uncharacterized protein n=1 Tax=Dreissena polymorpha TaxID=45954 RepID=A0A9D3Y9Q4_DREPO|nr:hypothetical protein DPMN_083928 [Dreissena polymorpha]